MGDALLKAPLTLALNLQKKYLRLERLYTGKDNLFSCVFESTFLQI